MLRAEPVTTPLANPQILERLFDTTLDEVFTKLKASPPPAPAPDALAAMSKTCGCGQSPLLAYFLTGERALLETLRLIEGWHMETGAAELYLTVRHLARRELATFCSVCQHRAKAAGGEASCPDEAQSYAMAGEQSW